MPEVGATSVREERVRGTETVGGRKLTKDGRSTIGDAASSVANGKKDDPAKFEEQWASWERQVEVDEKVPSSKQDDDVTVSVVL